MICTLHPRHRCDMQGEFSLQQLLDGAASHAQRVRIKGLLQLPPLAVAGMGSATLLDISDGRVQDFPPNFSDLRCLSILFASNNSFARAPCLRSLPALSMIAFRSNRMSELSSAALPHALRWLILTDNAIEHLPLEIGEFPLEFSRILCKCSRRFWSHRSL
jgi:Leucine-rich repeat (LRR) protein